MGDVISYFDHKRRAKGGRVRQVDPLIAEILEALLAVGGRAHRQMVADRIVQRRTGRSGPAAAAARDEIYAAFDAHLAWTATRRTPPLLWLPLGAGSYRWALTDAGHRLFQPASAAVRTVR